MTRKFPKISLRIHTSRHHLALVSQPGLSLIKCIFETFTLTVQLCNSRDPKDGVMKMKHPGAFTDTLKISATCSKFKTLHESNSCLIKFV